MIVKTSSIGHEERLVDVTLGLRDRLVDGLHQVEDGLAPLLVALERLERRDLDDRKVVARELVLGEQLTDLELDELQDLLVVHHVGLVQGDDDVRNADLAGQEHVLLGLRHRAVGGGDHEDGAVHLRGTGDHVLDVVRVTGAVDVGVVTRLRLVLDVRDRDRDTALALLRSLVDLVEGRGLVQVRVRVVQHLGNGGREGRLTVVDVTDGADVDVRLSPLELRLRHWGPPGSGSVRLTHRRQVIFAGMPAARGIPDALRAGLPQQAPVTSLKRVLGRVTRPWPSR